MSTAPIVPQPAPDPLGPEPVEPRPPQPSSRRGWLGVAAVAAVAAWQLFGPGFGGGGTGVATGPQFVPAVREDLERTIRIGGTITARRYAAIRAPRIRRGRRVGGDGGLTLVKMAAPGSFVKAGSVVAEFDRQDQEEIIDRQRAGVVQAEASIDRQKANLMLAMETLRQQLVAARGDADKAELDLRTAPVRSAIQAEILKAQMEEARANAAELEEELALLERSQAAALRQVELARDMEQVDLRRAELNADRMLVRTPIDGIVVLQTIFRNGTFAQSSAGDQVNPGAYFMQIVDPSDMVLETQVNQADVQMLRVGQTAEVRLDAYPDRVWKGRVDSIAAIAGGGSSAGRGRTGTGSYVRSVSVAVNILESDPVIIPDLSASADVLLETRPNVVTALREAIQQDADNWFVWLKGRSESDAPQRRPVVVEAWSDTHVAVGEGLKEGDLIALGRVEEPK